MKNKEYELKKYIPIKGYPLTYKDYPICHKEATKKEIEKFGLHKFHQLAGIILSHPDELLGTSNLYGKIFVSDVVPKKFREQVHFHEKQEVRCFSRKKH